MYTVQDVVIRWRRKEDHHISRKISCMFVRLGTDIQSGLEKVKDAIWKNTMDIRLALQILKTQKSRGNHQSTCRKKLLVSG